MSDHSLLATQKVGTHWTTPAVTGLLQRKCACGQHTMGGECEGCKDKRGMLQRKPANERSAGEVPPIVHEVLRSPGQPLDPAARAFMEPRFGYDFSQVRVHTDTKAAESALAVNALAYTVGRDIVFGASRYAPRARDGKRLLAHELTHVQQQRNEITSSARNALRMDAVDTPEEQEAQSAADRVLSDLQPASVPSRLSHCRDGLVRRQPNVPHPSPFLGQTNLTIDERGRVNITVAGPAKTPIVPSPAIGIGRDQNGQFHLLVGGKDKVISIDDIPALLRQTVGGQAAGSAKKPKFRVPTCAQLTLYAGKEKNRFMTFAQYQTRQKVFHSQISPLGGEVWLELTRPFFDALIDLCMMKLVELPRPAAAEKPSPGDFPERVLPEGSEFT